MNPEPSIERQREVFLKALEKPSPAERAAYLDGACGDDLAMRAQVEALLEHHATDSFLEDPAITDGKTQLVAGFVPEGPAAVIGRYKLLEKIGEGGCGVVYMAEQEEPVRRRVALKIIKLGLETKNVIARFEAERQALAMMDHPNIAKIYDGGVTGSYPLPSDGAGGEGSANSQLSTSNSPLPPGRPYFVMELVRGVRITDYCEQKNLSTRERLDLFIQVCQAIQHAHQKGVIHRDIKPSNVLVTENDGKAVPKVIDFGIAKATGQKLTDKTLFTQFAQFIGTPAYMSPEQAALTSVDIDTRADIYSLGVLLYELLTGTTPFDAQELLKSGFDEMRRIIRETEPEKPSTRLSTRMQRRKGEREKGSGEAGAMLESTPTLNSQLKSLSADLDWIVMKCLEKDRTRRYETANGLAADIQRHLSNEPVVARPPSAAYRFQKLVRRNKLTFAAGAAVAAALFIGLGLFLWQFLEKSKAYRHAQTEAAKSKHVAAFLADMLQGVGPSVALGRDTTLLREILDKTTERMGQDLKDQPEVEAELRVTIGQVYEALGDYAKAEAMQREALAMWTKLYGEEHREVATSLHSLASVLHLRGDLAGAEALSRKSLAMFRKLNGNEHRDVAVSLHNLAALLSNRGKLPEAESMYRESVAIHRKLYGNEHPEVAGALDGLAGVLHKQGKVAEAEATRREILALQKKLLGNRDPAAALSMNNRAVELTDQGNLEEAEARQRVALAIQKQVLSSQHPDLILSLRNLATVLSNQGKLAEAEAALNEALASSTHAPGRSADLLGRRGELWARQSRWQDATADLARAIELAPGSHVSYHLLAPLLVQSGDLEGYDKHRQTVFATFGSTDDPTIAERMAKDCSLLPLSGTGLEIVRRWADLAVAAGSNHWAWVWFQFAKGLAEYRQGNFGAAVDWMQNVLKGTDETDNRAVEACMVLAMAHHRLGHQAEAKAALAQGQEIAATKLPKAGSADLGGGWNDWVIAQLLMREAKALIEGQSKPEQETEKKPESPKEAFP